MTGCGLWSGKKEEEGTAEEKVDGEDNGGNGDVPWRMPTIRSLGFNESTAQGDEYMAITKVIIIHTSSHYQ